MGFKGRKELAFEDNTKHSFFIYPDEMVRFSLLRCQSLRVISEIFVFVCVWWRAVRRPRHRI